MSRLERALAAAAVALARSSFALVGGIAVSARTEPRFTRDLDLAVATPDDATAEELVRTMTARGFRVAAVIEQEAVGRLASSRGAQRSSRGPLLASRPDAARPLPPPDRDLAAASAWSKTAANWPAWARRW